MKFEDPRDADDAIHNADGKVTGQAHLYLQLVPACQKLNTLPALEQTPTFAARPR